MNPSFSWQTQQLLNRADKAIEHSIEAREYCARGLAEARRWMLHVELALYGDRAETIRKETAHEVIARGTAHARSVARR
jgi:hypothetical protein